MTHARQEKFSAKIMLERHNNDRCIGPGDIDKASGLLDQQKRTGHKLTCIIEVSVKEVLSIRQLVKNQYIRVIEKDNVNDTDN